MSHKTSSAAVRIELAGMDMKALTPFFAGAPDTLKIIARQVELTHTNGEARIRWPGWEGDAKRGRNRIEPAGCLEHFLKLSAPNAGENDVLEFAENWGPLAVERVTSEQDAVGTAWFEEPVETYIKYARQAEALLLITADIASGKQPRDADWFAAVGKYAGREGHAFGPERFMLWPADKPDGSERQRYFVAHLASVFIRKSGVVPALSAGNGMTLRFIVSRPERFDVGDFDQYEALNRFLLLTSGTRSPDGSGVLKFDEDYWPHTGGLDQPSRTFAAIAVQLAAVLTSQGDRLHRCCICSRPVTKYKRKLRPGLRPVCTNMTCENAHHNQLQKESAARPPDEKRHYTRGT